MKAVVIIRVLLILAVSSMFLSAQEVVYPSGYDITSQYLLYDGSVDIDDTLIIHRTIVNSELFTLTGLYFSENLPPEFEVADQSIEINGSSVDYLFSGPIYNLEIQEFDTYVWLVDSPLEQDGIDNEVLPGDTVVFRLGIISSNIGMYTLPFHATVFYNDGTGFFSTSDSLRVEFTMPVDVGEEMDSAELLPSERLNSMAYPNPFNSSVFIKYSGRLLGGKRIYLVIYDLLGRSLYDHEFVATNDWGDILWFPEESVSSGLYFYRISSSNESSTGKIILLK